MGPLAGLKILDFSTLLPGPYATMMLADLGAQVLRVEAPDREDMVRAMPPFLDDNKKVSAAHASLNRNKQSITLDLKRADSVARVKALIEDYDIVVEQFRPGVMGRLGLDYETLAEINPRLIYCAITGYGQTGPKHKSAGHDINYLALSGLASYGGSREPSLVATQVADIAAGSHNAAMGIMAAVIERHSSGQGQFIDISMCDGAFALNAAYGANTLASGKPPQPQGEMLNGGFIYDYYRCQDGRYLSVGSLEPQFLQGFLQVLERPEWLLRCGDLSPENQQALKKDIQARIASKTQQQWLELFSPRDVCVEPVLDVLEAANSELFAEREMLVQVPLQDCSDSVLQIALPIKFSRSQISYRYAGKEKGRDNQEVLGHD